MSQYVKPKRWVPTLYYMQGLPYAVVFTVTPIFYKNFNISNTAIAFFTSLLVLPWILKPLWSPILEVLATKKLITVATQFSFLAMFTLLALSLNLSQFFTISLLLFGCLAFASASHDIASDGLYIISLKSRDQAAFVGIRTFFYQFARFSCQGGLVVLEGLIAKYHSNIAGWQVVFVIVGLVSLCLAVYHSKILPQPEINKLPAIKFHNIVKTFGCVIRQFITLPNIFVLVIFLLIYNMPEAQLMKIVPLFFLDKLSVGGLGFNNVDVGLLLGGLGVFSLMCGAVLGGWMIARFSLRRVLLPVTLFSLLSNISYLLLSTFQIHQLWMVGIVVIAVQYAYGMSNSVFMTFLLFSVSRGKYQMSCYAIGTAMMALGIALAGSVSGYIQYYLGYHGFFIWILLLGFSILLFTRSVVKHYVPQEIY